MAFLSSTIYLASSLFLLGSAASIGSIGGVTRKVGCPSGRTASRKECCVWFDVRDDLQANLFHNECAAEVHETLRATFHDAIPFSKSLSSGGKFGGGGADGSLIKFSDVEFQNPANEGLQDIVDDLKKMADKHNVSYGDIIQFGGAVGMSNCQGSPPLKGFVGRPTATKAAPPNLIPRPTDSVSKILSRFNDAGINVSDTVWLLAAHSVAAQNHVDPTIAGSPFDTTPGVFDTQFYLEVLLKGTLTPGQGGQGEALSPLEGLMVLESDHLMARDPKTACLWQLPINNQTFINQVFALAMQRMSILGHSQSDLIDCTEAVPIARPNTKATTFPAGKSKADLDLPNIKCKPPFPHLASDPGSAKPVPTASPY